MKLTGPATSSGLKTQYLFIDNDFFNGLYLKDFLEAPVVCLLHPGFSSVAKIFCASWVYG